MFTYLQELTVLRRNHSKPHWLTSHFGIISLSSTTLTRRSLSRALFQDNLLTSVFVERFSLHDSMNIAVANKCPLPTHTPENQGNSAPFNKRDMIAFHGQRSGHSNVPIPCSYQSSPNTCKKPAC